MERDPEVIEYIEQFPAEYREILFRLRDLIYDVVPDAGEAIRWQRPSFSYNGRIICYIGGFQNHVTFAFHNGTMLNDPERLLEGSGKQMQFIRFKRSEDIDEEQMKIWIMEGFYT